MSMNSDERAELTAWLVQLTEEMESLSRRVRVLAVAIRHDQRPPPEEGPPPPGG